MVGIDGVHLINEFSGNIGVGMAAIEDGEAMFFLFCS